MKPFPFYKQLDAMDCGPTCLRMIAKYYGKHYTLETLRAKTGITREGVSLLGISEAAEAIGFHTLAVKTSIEKLAADGIFPAIAHWGQKHFVVVYKIKRDKIYIADPERGLLNYTKAGFSKQWAATEQNGELQGIVLALEPMPAFFKNTGEQDTRLNLKLIGGYLWAYKKLLFQLLLGLLIGSLLQLVFPFLTQSIVDVGINGHDVQFIYLVLLAQLMLFLGQASVEFIRSWVLLHINTRLSVSILTGFLTKLMKLPIAFFEGKMVGDIIQRMADQRRIQDFLTGPSLSVLFSFFNFIVFIVVIFNYNITVFITFLTGSTLYMLWVLLFMRYRRALDHKRFDLTADSQTNMIQLVNGMQEIKMNNSETTRRWQWERIQASLFKVNVKALELSQYQQGGAVIINQGKNILITFFSALAVVHGQLTLGSMLAIQYIVGQLNGPVEQLILFVQLLQDALISLERLNEIHALEDEEPDGSAKIAVVPGHGDIILDSVNFSYPGAGNLPVLSDIHLAIPRGEVTAVVGVSGSGKTTLLKLLMKFYKASEGSITIDGIHFNDIANNVWRAQCGAVLQDSFIFSDSIARNIAVADEEPDMDRLLQAVKIANINEFVLSLPLGFNTMIGASGNGLSQGQKQRLLIARAAYKNPEFIFFDEATNALDANNEMAIMQNLETFFKGKTVVIAAHRLSTVKHAHQIIVMDKGRIIEKGNHNELVALKGAYFALVSNQLELEG